MLSCLKKLWNAITSGWVVEYPDSNKDPQDLFDRKDRIPYGSQRRNTEMN